MDGFSKPKGGKCMTALYEISKESGNVAGLVVLRHLDVAIEPEIAAVYL